MRPCMGGGGETSKTIVGGPTMEANAYNPSTPVMEAGGSARVKAVLGHTASPKSA